MALLDELGVGIVIVNRFRRVIHANRAGRDGLGAGAVLLEAERMLCASNPCESGALQEAVEAACRGQRRFVLLGTEPARGAVVVLPLRGMESAAEPLAVVLLKRERIAADLGLYLFSRAYGLTDAEERVLDHISRGASARVIAREIECAECTVRTHIRHVLDKTSTAGLRELTVLLGTMPPVASWLGGVAAPAGVRHPAIGGQAATARPRGRGLSRGAGL